MNISKEALLPKDKSDTSTIDKLKCLSNEEIMPIIPDLLEWLQDINWIVAPYIADVLLQHQKISERFIAELLSENQKDDIWKYWIINELLLKWDDIPCNEIMTELSRISKFPTKGEKTEEADVSAKKCLKKFM